MSWSFRCVNCDFGPLSFASTNNNSTTDCPVSLDSPIPLPPDVHTSAGAGQGRQLMSGSNCNTTTYVDALTLIFDLPDHDHDNCTNSNWYLCGNCANVLGKLIGLYAQLTLLGPSQCEWFQILRDRANLTFGSGSGSSVPGAVKQEPEDENETNDYGDRVVDSLELGARATGTGTGTGASRNSEFQALVRPCNVEVERCDNLWSQNNSNKRQEARVVDDEDPETDFGDPVPDDDFEPDDDLGQSLESDEDTGAGNLTESESGKPLPAASRKRTQPRTRSRTNSDSSSTKPKRIRKSKPSNKNKTQKAEIPSTTCAWCPTPSSIFASYSAYISHIQIHANEPGVPTCNLPRRDGTGPCNRVLANESKRRLHLKTTHSDSSSPCEICGKLLSSEPRRKLHMKLIHSEVPLEKIFACDKCDQSFTLKDGLRNHIRNRHGDKVYTCHEPNCNYSSKSPQSYYDHLRRTHNPKGSTSQCHLCPKIFKTSYSLREHIISQHENKRRWICSSFGHPGGGPGPRFNLKWTLITHIVLRHGPMDKKVALEIANRPESQTDEPWTEEHEEGRRSRREGKWSKWMQMGREKLNDLDESNGSSSQYFE